MSTSPFESDAGGEGDRVDQRLEVDGVQDDVPASPTSDDVPADQADRLDQATPVAEDEDDYPREPDE
ncbi:hypothetical protein [Ornithinimicrobium murale]|uniref:hypothetical protein n=1 Tax=Ornithinimicrobium murale TaxID=1050153 RepID=UPI000E0CE5BE|nr:hypothetical protein [Ornithinimicrobium murale]